MQNPFQLQIRQKMLLRRRYLTNERNGFHANIQNENHTISITCYSYGSKKMLNATKGTEKVSTMFGAKQLSSDSLSMKHLLHHQCTCKVHMDYSCLHSEAIPRLCTCTPGPQQGTKECHNSHLQDQCWPICLLGYMQGIFDPGGFHQGVCLVGAI